MRPRELTILPSAALAPAPSQEGIRSLPVSRRCAQDSRRKLKSLGRTFQACRDKEHNANVCQSLGPAVYGARLFRCWTLAVRGQIQFDVGIYTSRFVALQIPGVP